MIDMKILEEYRKIIFQLIDATELSKIVWKRQNPSTIFYEKITKNDEKAIMSVQSVGPRQRNHFVFNVQNTSKNEIIVSIDSTRDREFQEMLNDLFDKGMYSIEKRSLNFLRDILSDIG